MNKKMGRLCPGVSTVIVERHPKLFKHSEMFGRRCLNVPTGSPCRPRRIQRTLPLCAFRQLHLNNFTGCQAFVGGFKAAKAYVEKLTGKMNPSIVREQLVTSCDTAQLGVEIRE